MKKTNFDIYKKELNMITSNGYVVGVKNNKPVRCVDVNCKYCDLNKYLQCQVGLIQWLLLPNNNH